MVCQVGGAHISLLVLKFTSPPFAPSLTIKKRLQNCKLMIVKHFDSRKIMRSSNCVIWNIFNIALLNHEVQAISRHPINVASENNGGRCTWAIQESYPWKGCSSALTRRWEWVPRVAVGGAMTITFNNSYRINKTRIMQQVSYLSLAKTVQLKFSDGTEIMVSTDPLPL